MDVLWCSLFFCKRWFGQTPQNLPNYTGLPFAALMVIACPTAGSAVMGMARARVRWSKERGGWFFQQGRFKTTEHSGKCMEMPKAQATNYNKPLFWDCQVHLLVGFNYFRGYISDAQLGWAKNAVLHLRYILERKVSKHEKWGHEPWLKNLGYTYYFLCNDQEW